MVTCLTHKDSVGKREGWGGGGCVGREKRLGEERVRVVRIFYLESWLVGSFDFRWTRAVQARKNGIQRR